MRKCDKCGTQKEVQYIVCHYDLCYKCNQLSKPIVEGAEKKVMEEWIKRGKKDGL